MADAFLMGNGGTDLSLTVQTITSSGTFTVPSNVDKIFVWMCGAGGGGSYGSYGVSITTIGKYGASSGFVVQLGLNVTPGQQFSVVIGAGGAAGTSSSPAGGKGGDTSFGSYTAIGGTGSSGSDSSSSPPPGAVYGTSLSADIGSTSSSRSIGPSSPTEGNGNGYPYPGVTDKGYCWLTGATYCGGGGLGVFYWNNNSLSTISSLSFSAIANSNSGGGGVGAVQVTSGAIVTNGPGNNANKYGAAGGSGNFLQFNNFVDDYPSNGGSGANGVVIIGYYA